MKILFLSSLFRRSKIKYGDIAQLGARLTGSQEVRGSNPLSSTNKKHTFVVCFLFSIDRHAFRAKLANESFLEPFYLAGDTALALHLGHRRSEVLDFFPKINLFP